MIPHKNNQSLFSCPFNASKNKLYDKEMTGKNI
jgi:hypothetical protein